MHPLDPTRALTRSRLRVRFCETDLMGIVHHSNYLAYFEAGRVEWLRRRGVTYGDWAARGMHLPVVEAGVRYRAPARFDDVITIETRLVELRAASLRFEYRMERGAARSRGEPRETELLAEGSTRLACVDDKHAVRRFSQEMLAVLGSAETAPPGDQLG
jgi:acyl-CoA thioester hydrolase